MTMSVPPRRRVRAVVGRILVTCAVAALLSSQPAFAQFSQQGPKLVGSGAVGAFLQGFSVSLSADGNTAIVGGTDDNTSLDFHGPELT